MTILLLYLSVLFVIGIYDYRKVRNFDDYVVAGRKQKEGIVAMSILATVIGASATMGISSLAVKHGFAAFLWLGSGGAALILQSVFLSEKIRSLNVYTLPGLAEATAGREGKILTALVIIISWTGIIAAQFIALSSIVALLTGKQATALLITVCSSVIIIYTAFGGQFSIMKTDALQFVLLAAGLAAALFSVVFSGGIDVTQLFTYAGTEGNQITFVKILHLIFVVGGVYFIGPDIFSRNFTSDSASTAKKATLKAGIALLLFSIVITVTGTGAALVKPGIAENPYIFIIKNISGTGAGIIITLGLLSAIISSTDTCIMTASAIMEKDILGKSSVFTTRILVFITGFASLALALFKKDILSLLVGTYSVFSPGVVFPVFTAIMAKGKRKIIKPLWLSAVITGGLFGVASGITGKEYISLAGMAVSAVLSFLSVMLTDKKKPE